MTHNLTHTYEYHTHTHTLMVQLTHSTHTLMVQLIFCTGGTELAKEFSQNVNQLFKDSINSTIQVHTLMMDLPISLLQSQLSDINSIVLKLQKLNELEQEIISSNKNILDTLNYPFQSLNTSSSQLKHLLIFPEQVFQSMNQSFYSTLYPTIMYQIGYEMMNHILPIANAYVSILSNFNNTESIFTLLPRQLGKSETMNHIESY